ncbi:TPA: exosome complex protein Rrp42 [Candidatus Woesearchaeota archaeon]|nr:exosome complex protein Rrp42 [Candidatus Woesearchaeota archaeon]HIH31545.1 exosome complex protein Rrp42 [Candidatus Woesearchaeota archaeon]HIH54297.1 exosome complex protein Rrp42 [Candidatus Woesearchaeota archaeon]HIJ02513.1 exosome complex protein Rrp42 [Candidatus Woesearchaeota archaeon]HIJ13441.1 exosome complex protein Rrp42 [Candidatus Woesearchaeota archaeon]
MDFETKKHIIECLEKDVRYDGRKKDEYREIEFKIGLIETAEGSAYVKCGNTEVIAGVKISVEKPFPDTPEDGILMVGAELLPLSNPKYESGPPDSVAIEVARVIDRGIRESKSIDTKSLCIVKGEKVWSISVDISPINDDGNLIDIGSMAAVAAILNAKFPKYENDKVDYKAKTDSLLPFNKIPVAATVLKLGNNFIIDPTELEQEAADSRLTVTITEDNKLCAIQKGGDGTLSIEDIDKMMSMAIGKSHEIRKHIKQ